MKGFVHAYTGNGKGKSTAAFGLAMRAVGAGKRVFVAQFVKEMKYSEITCIEQYLPQIETKQFGLGCFIRKEPSVEDIQAARQGFEEVVGIVKDDRYDIVILDEVFIALYFQLLTEEDIIELIKAKPERMELVLTGRYATEPILAMCDLVTEMKEVKHYYTQGVLSRKGIDC
ncbi:cob(I)yrinic acid a,c-diamide adenosyltransferase [Puteibacter caeruleilacunae]|nr:cob(I)yrinic acid a,c-diamide adenosyltransferase [Puteibacter caeruleilacunae]